jgi:MarR family 2-MHQ and catechol resistance regulon transcriptional repressor
MTAAANRLEKKGFIKRIQDPSDGRCFYLYLTKTGRRLIKKAFDRHARNLEKLADALNDEERSELLRLLKKMGRHAQNLTLN